MPNYQHAGNASMINAAIAGLAALGGGELQLVDDEFRLETAIVLKSGVRLVGYRGRAPTLVPTFSGSLTDPTNAIIKALGAFDTAKLDTTLNSTMVIPASSVAALSVAGASLAPGDWIIIGDDGTSLRRAQLAQVSSSYGGGTTIPLVSSPFLGNNAGPKMRGWTPITGIGIHDIDLMRTGASVATGIYLRGVVGYELSGLRYDSFNLGLLAAEDYGSIRGPAPGKKLYEPSTRWLPDLSVMTLGDSISVQSAPSDYQSYLYLRLRRELFGRANVRFIGTDNGMYPLFVEGHPGFTIATLNTNIATYLAGSRPDVICILAGVNTIAADVSGAAAATDMETLVNSIRTNADANAKPRVVVCKIPSIDARWANYSASRLTEIGNYNNALPTKFAPLSGTANHKRYVTIVDCSSGFESTTMNYDGVHPNADGATLIADRIFEGALAGGYEV